MKRAEKLAKRNYPFIVEKDDMGYYAVVPDLKGCSTWAKTFKELESALYEAKLAWIECALKRRISIPEPKELSSKVWTSKIQQYYDHIEALMNECTGLDVFDLEEKAIREIEKANALWPPEPQCDHPNGLIISHRCRCGAPIIKQCPICGWHFDTGHSFCQW